MTPLATRTLWECQPCGSSMVASARGWRGSATSTMVVPCGACICAMNSVVPSTQTCPPPGQSMCDTRLVLDRLATARSQRWGKVIRGRAAARAQPLVPSGDFHDVAGGVAAPLLEQMEALQRRLVARDEEDGWPLVVAVDVLEPGAAGHRQIVERLPVEA